MGLYEKSLVEKLKTLISIHTENPPGNVRGVAEALRDFGVKTNAEMEFQTVEEGKDNALLSYSFGQGKTLVFNTHMDVNNPNGQAWEFNSYDPFEKDGKVFGLGACDAKGSLAAMLQAIQRVCQNPEGVRGTLLLTAVMGEEAGGIGSLYLVTHKNLRAEGAVVGEPSMLVPCCAHKGTYMRRLTFHGKAVHSASSHSGINAVEHACIFCVRYRELQQRLKADAHPRLGYANASVTLMEGGTRQNTIPETCRVLIDRRLLPGETKEKAQEEVGCILEGISRELPDLQKVDIEEVVSTVPSQTDEDEEIVKLAVKAVLEVTGKVQEPGGFQAGCDMSKLVNISGIPTVILGPGSLKHAHSPNEEVDIGQLEAAAGIYENIIRGFLS